jgi:hypothetical protein
MMDLLSTPPLCPKPNSASTPIDKYGTSGRNVPVYGLGAAGETSFLVRLHSPGHGFIPILPSSHQAAKSRDENSRIHLPASAPTSETWTALSCIDPTLHSHATNVDTARAENSKEWRRISNISKRVDPCHECFHYHSRSIVHFF